MPIFAIFKPYLKHLSYEKKNLISQICIDLHDIYGTLLTEKSEKRLNKSHVAKLKREIKLLYHFVYDLDKRI